MTAMRALFATLLGLAPAAPAVALTCGDLAGRTFGNARTLETLGTRPSTSSCARTARPGRARATPCASGCAGGLRRAGVGYCFLRPPRTAAARICGNMRLFPGAGGE